MTFTVKQAETTVFRWQRKQFFHVFAEVLEERKVDGTFTEDRRILTSSFYFTLWGHEPDVREAQLDIMFRRGL